MIQSKHTHRLGGLVLIFLMSTFGVFAQQAKPLSPNTNTNVVTQAKKDKQVFFNTSNTTTPPSNNGGEVIDDNEVVLDVTPTHLTLGPGSIHNSIIHTVAGSGVNANNIAPTVVNCPMMHVDVDLPFAQSCLSSTANISYCNHGTQVATDVYVDVTLESVLTLDSAEIAYTALGGNKYRFQLGTVGISGCDNFEIYVTTDCDTSLIGTDHCIQANIYPDTLCNSVLNAHVLYLQGTCDNGIINFKITNHGLPITAAEQIRYVVTEDHLLFQQGAGTTLDTLIDTVLVLGANITEEIKIPNPYAKDYTLKIVDHNNNNLIASSTVANCNVNNTSNLMINDYHSNLYWDNVVPYEAIGCAKNSHTTNQTSTILSPSAKPLITDNNSVPQSNRASSEKELFEDPTIIYAYPNPFNDFATIRIEGPIADNFQFKLYDVTGRVVQQKEVSKERSFKVERGTLLPGIYLYRIEAEGEQVGIGKLMIN